MYTKKVQKKTSNHVITVWLLWPGSFRQQKLTILLDSNKTIQLVSALANEQQAKSNNL